MGYERLHIRVHISLSRFTFTGWSWLWPLGLVLYSNILYMVASNRCEMTAGLLLLLIFEECNGWLRDTNVSISRGCARSGCASSLLQQVLLGIS